VQSSTGDTGQTAQEPRSRKAEIKRSVSVDS
jgi:hypothetical protein